MHFPLPQIQVAQQQKENMRSKIRRIAYAEGMPGTMRIDKVLYEPKL